MRMNTINMNIYDKNIAEVKAKVDANMSVYDMLAFLNCDFVDVINCSRCDLIDMVVDAMASELHL